MMVWKIGRVNVREYQYELGRDQRTFEWIQVYLEVEREKVSYP